MKNSKLINILRTFSEKEIKQLEKFVASPYHNSGKNCMPLFKELQEFYGRFDSEKLIYENLYRKLYPGKKFNKQVMWNLCSALEKLSAEFLIHQSVNKNTFEKHARLIDGYLDKKLYSICAKEIKKMESFLFSQKIDTAFFSNKAVLDEYKKELNLREDKQHLVCKNVLDKGNSVILSFVMALSDTISDLNANYIMYNARFDFNIPLELTGNLDLNKMIDYMKEHRYEYTYIMELYSYLILTVTEPENENNYLKLKRIFEQYSDKLTFSQKYLITGKMVNYCIANSEKPGFMRILFELNNYRLKENLLFHPENRIPKIVYIQMVINALSLDEIKWAENFIATCTPRLKPEIREAMHALASAYLYAALKRYDKVLDFLNKVEYIDVRDKIHVKILTARSYYELQQIETLLSFIDTSRHFLKNNNNVNENRKKNYTDFFNILHKLVSVKEHPSDMGLDSLKNEIMSTKKLNYRKWFLEKLDELQKK